MTLSKLQVDVMYDENTPAYYAVRASGEDVFDSKERAIAYRLRELHDLLRNFGDIFSEYNKLYAELPNWRPYD